MTTISVKGTITPGEYSWVYDLFGIPYTSPEQFKAQLAAADDDVIVEINSPGGVVTAASEMYEAIRAFEGNIECRVIGQAASAASIIACAAKNSISPMGTLFLHNCIGSAEGNHNDMREAAQAMESVDENIMGAYRDKTGLPDAQIYRLMERNTTLSASKAVELGFIDRITESAADAARPGASVVSGLAAGAPGFFDPTAIDAERLVAMRKLYEESKQAIGEGGETAMAIEDIKAEAEAAPEAEEAEAIEPEAAEPEADDAEGQEAAEAEAEAGEGAEPEPDEEPTTPDEPEHEPEADEHEPEDAFNRGVMAERERVAAIMDIAASVPDSMVRAALFAEPISAEELALAAIRAESERRAGYMESARADLAASGNTEVAAEVSGDAREDEVSALAAKVKERF